MNTNRPKKVRENIYSLAGLESVSFVIGEATELKPETFPK